MIDARELRIGNWVEAPCFGIVNSIQKTLTISDIQHCQEFPDSYNPIPLTEEWFNRFEYIEIPTEYNQGGITCVNSIWSLRDCDDGTIGKEIKYVHEYQNLVFALTGIELKLK